MPITNKKKIRAYCDQHEIFVPAGFDRNSASRYAIVRLDISPKKLIAKTWFNKTDVIYYIENILESEIDGDINQAVDILDFQEARRLNYKNPGKLETTEAFITEYS